MSTIYNADTANIITEGVQSQKFCDATINTARSIAAEKKIIVVVEDEDAEECYSVLPNGDIEDAPAGWAAGWED